MDLRDQPLSVANMQECLNCDVLDVGANKLFVFNMIMHVIIDVLSGVTVMNQTVAELVQEFDSCNLNTV